MKVTPLCVVIALIQDSFFNELKRKMGYGNSEKTSSKGDVVMGTVFHNVQSVLENYQSAVHEKNVEKFLSTYASDIHIYDCWENWECIGISAWREKATEWFNSLSDEGVFLKVDFNDLVVEADSYIAFVHGAVTFAAHNEDSGRNFVRLLIDLHSA